MVRGAFRAWAAFGGDPEAFWRLTPFQTREWCAGRVSGLEREARDQLAHAWHTARLTGLAMVGGFPTFAELVEPPDGAARASRIAAVLHAMADRSAPP